MQGADGAAGNNGRGIEKTEINDKGELVVTYTDGQTENLGQVQGAKQHPLRTVLGILLGVLAGIAASLGVLHFLMPGAVNEQLKQWGLL